MKVENSTRTKSPYENNFDPSFGFNLYLGLEVRSRVPRRRRTLYHLR
jgi:hypothetical protein